MNSVRIILVLHFFFSFSFMDTENPRTQRCPWLVSFCSQKYFTSRDLALSRYVAKVAGLFTCATLHGQGIFFVGRWGRINKWICNIGIMCYKHSGRLLEEIFNVKMQKGNHCCPILLNFMKIDLHPHEQVRKISHFCKK